MTETTGQRAGKRKDPPTSISDAEFTDGDVPPSLTPGLSHKGNTESNKIVDVKGDEEYGYSHSRMEERKKQFIPVKEFLPNWLKQDEKCTSLPVVHPFLNTFYTLHMQD